MTLAKKCKIAFGFSFILVCSMLCLSPTVYIANSITTLPIWTQNVSEKMEQRHHHHLDSDCKCRWLQNTNNFSSLSKCGENGDDRGTGQKVLSFSFYGQMNTKYFQGIEENAVLAERIFSDYVLRQRWARGMEGNTPILII